MVQLTIDDPAIHTVKNTDAQGRVYLGKGWKDKRVRVTVEEVDGDE